MAGLPMLPRTGTKEVCEKKEETYPQVEEAVTKGEQEVDDTSVVVSPQSTMKVLGITGLKRHTQTSSTLHLAEVSIRIKNSDLATYRVTRKRVLSVGHVWPLKVSREVWAAVVEVLFAEAAPPEDERPSNAQAVQLFLESILEHLPTLFPESRDGWVSASKLYAAFLESEQALPISQRRFSSLLPSCCQKKRRSSGVFYCFRLDDPV
ncbi:MAG: hypothetical protein D3904_09780 [Candidatus Electrothrix sp. EH2]|nr:hypothetical protein [Candidatus Electrothrix sp. EH2]